MHTLSKNLKLHELKIVQWNCFKLTQARIFELGEFLKEFQPDIISIQEIKMNQEQAILLYIYSSGLMATRYTIDPETKMRILEGVRQSLSRTQLLMWQLLTSTKTWTTLE